ncbi:MAG: hypothetical protein ACHQ4F_02965, partial [Candidatus Dormibacteria bacterium]
MLFPHARLTSLLAMTGALVAACGGPSSQTTPTPTPLTATQIKAKYTSAATHYNAADVQIALTENAACDALSATVALGACQTALSA